MRTMLFTVVCLWCFHAQATMQKIKYLTSLFSEVYLKDIVERKKIERADVLEQILDLLCSSIGSLTNPTKIANTLKSKTNGGISVVTIASYMEHLEGAFFVF